MKYPLIDYMSERLEKRKYRAKKKAYRERKPTPMDSFLDSVERRYRFLSGLEDGADVIRYFRVIADGELNDVIDRFVLSYRQWCRNRNYEYEEIDLNRDIYEHLRGRYSNRRERYSVADEESSGTVAFTDGDDEKTLLDRYCGEPLPQWDPNAEGDDLLYEEMLLL